MRVIHHVITAGVVATVGLALTVPLAACGDGATPSDSTRTTASGSPAVTTAVPTATAAGPTSATGPPTSERATSRPPPTAPPTTVAPPFPDALAGLDLERIPTSDKIIALTFDAGANADAVAPILATLDQKGVTGTFFLTGNFVTVFPGPSQQIAAAGHRIGNHTIDHPHLPSLSDAQVREQMRGAEASIRAVTGADPGPLFRFPFGDRDARTIALVNQAGYVAIRWSVDSLGWQGTMGGTRGAAFVRDRVIGAATPGGIVLMHVGSNPDDHSTLDADALPAIIDGLRARGYSFVTLDVLLT